MIFRKSDVLVLNVSDTKTPKYFTGEVVSVKRLSITVKWHDNTTDDFDKDEEAIIGKAKPGVKLSRVLRKDLADVLDNGLEQDTTKITSKFKLYDIVENDTKTVSGKTAYRLKAKVDFVSNGHDVKTGDTCGYITLDSTISGNVLIDEKSTIVSCKLSGESVILSSYIMNSTVVDTTIRVSNIFDSNIENDSKGEYTNLAISNIRMFNSNVKGFGYLHESYIEKSTILKGSKVTGSEVKNSVLDGDEVVVNKTVLQGSKVYDRSYLMQSRLESTITRGGANVFNSTLNNCTIEGVIKNSKLNKATIKIGQNLEGK
jgi:hypothetical protein